MRHPVARGIHLPPSAAIGGTRRCSGQALLISVISLTALLGAVALVLDIASAYFEYMALQSACDSAALAGAAYLPSLTSSALSVAKNYALNNGILASEIQGVAVAPDGMSITVSAARTVQTTFAAVVGIKQFSISASGTAGAQPAGSAEPTIPVGVQYTTSYSNGQSVALHAGGAGPGNWSGLALGGTGGSLYRDNLVNGYQGMLHIGDLVQSEPGATVGPTAEGIATRIANGLLADPTATWSNHSLADPRVVTVPLVDWKGCQGSCTVPIKGFLEIWVLGTSGPDILGVFIAQAVSGDSSGGSIPSALHVTLLR